MLARRERKPAQRQTRRGCLMSLGARRAAATVPTRRDREACPFTHVHSRVRKVHCFFEDAAPSISATPCTLPPLLKLEGDDDRARLGSRARSGGADGARSPGLWKHAGRKPQPQSFLKRSGGRHRAPPPQRSLARRLRQSSAARGQKSTGCGAQSTSGDRGGPRHGGCSRTGSACSPQCGRSSGRRAQAPGAQTARPGRASWCGCRRSHAF
jgi:hypothetical protein